MPVSRFAFLAFLLVLAVGLEPADAGAHPLPPPSGGEMLVAAGPAGSPSAPLGGAPLSVPAAPPPAASWASPTLDDEASGPWPGVGGDPAANPDSDDPIGPEEASPSPPAPACPPAPADVSPVPVVRSGAPGRKVVALTFDDGWDGENTLRILRILRGARVNATFFPLGRAIESAPSEWRAVAAAGYPIADHTYDHATLAGRCYRTQLAELTRFQATARSILGITPLPVMRPPGGAFDETTRLAAAGAGEEAVVRWDVDTRDWSGLRAATIASRALAGGPGAIVLMHTFPANTAAALPAIIAGYRGRGFGFVTIGTLLGLGGPVPFD